MKLYQEQFKQGYIRGWGCLVTSMINGVNQAINAGLIYDDIDLISELALIERAGWNDNYPVMSDGENLDEKGSYVWDHEKLMNIILKVAGRDDKRAFYKARVDFPRDNEIRVPKKPSIIIGQFDTKWGSHFKLLFPNEIDPAENGLETLGLMSLRFYNIIDV